MTAPGRAPTAAKARLARAWRGAELSIGATVMQVRRYRSREGENRSQRLNPRFTVDELAEVVAAAASVGMTPTGFCADSALAAARGTPRVLEDAQYREEPARLQRQLFDARTAVVRFGTNVNQAVAQLHRTGEAPEWMVRATRRAVESVQRLDVPAGRLHRVGWWDKVNSRRRCYELELRFGLRRVGPADRTGHRRPSGAEVNKAKRLGRALTARDELRRHVRAAAAASANEEQFFARLGDAGVLVSLRPSVTRPGEITGHSVALPTDTNAAGEPVYFGGGRLARDLTLPKLRQRWASPDGQTPSSDGPVRISTQARIDALNAAAEAVRGAADAIGRLAGTDPRAAVAIAQATSDTLAAIATAVEGQRGGPITAAVDLFDHAAREPNGAVAKASQRSWDLRAMSRLVHLMGRLSGDEDTFAMLVLLLDLARLADTLASLRQAQQRHHPGRRRAARRRVAAVGRGDHHGAARSGASFGGARPDRRSTSPGADRPVAGPSTRDERHHRGR